MELSVVHSLRQHPVARQFRIGVLTCTVCAFLVGTSVAGQLESFSIVVENGAYITSIVALLDAPAEYVYSVITDYKHIYRINSSIIETRVATGGDSGAVRVSNRLEHCFTVFCIKIDLVEDVVKIGEQHIVSTTVPELSSFKSGTAMWHVRPFTDGRARVRYSASIEPDFFIPPLIGTAIMKSSMRREIMDSLTKIECHARILALKNLEEIPLRAASISREKQDCTG